MVTVDLPGTGIVIGIAIIVALLMIGGIAISLECDEHKLPIIDTLVVLFIVMIIVLLLIEFLHSQHTADKQKEEQKVSNSNKESYRLLEREVERQLIEKGHLQNEMIVAWTGIFILITICLFWFKEILGDLLKVDIVSAIVVIILVIPFYYFFNRIKKSRSRKKSAEASYQTANTKLQRRDKEQMEREKLIKPE